MGELNENGDAGSDVGGVSKRGKNVNRGLIRSGVGLPGSKCARCAGCGCGFGRS